MGEPVVDKSDREMVRGEKKLQTTPEVAIKVFKITLSDKVLNSVCGARDPPGIQGIFFSLPTILGVDKDGSKFKN